VTANGPSRRTRRNKTHLSPEETPLDLPEDKSMRNLLLSNISEQHTLATRLFETLSLSLSASRRMPSANSTSTLDSVAPMYARLQELTEEHAQLVELARKHRDRWERLQRKLKRKQALEEQVRRVLVQLQQGRREVCELIDEGEEVLKGIEQAEKGERSDIA
jgi:septal ring factor EnvC (AmiA/AmiB activator)